MKHPTTETERLLLLKLAEFKVKCQEQPFDGLEVLKKLVRQNKEKRNGTSNQPKTRTNVGVTY
jgi:hypothetical protein